MRKILSMAFMLCAAIAGFAQFNVTFQVDMNGVSASFNTPELNGTFNEWCGNCIQMSDANNDGIWEVTVPLAAGTYEYKFSYDAWAGAEQLTSGSACTVSAGGFTNRVVTIDSDITLPVVCWGTCEACAAVVQQQMDLPVTFDDSNVEYGLIGFGGAESSSIVPDPTNAANTVAQVVKSATAQSWAGTTITAPAEMGLATPIAFAPGQTQMTLRVWSPDAGIPVRLKVEDHTDNTRSVETEATTTQAAAWETLTFNFANQAAGTAAINYTYSYDKASVFFNFGTTGAVAGEKTYYFDDLDLVIAAPVTYNVTFSVDMTTSGITPNFVNVSGTFNDWCGDCNQMTDANSDGIWEVTLPLLVGAYEYKFSYNNWAGSEQLSLGTCTVENDGFVNRSLVVAADAVLPTVCYASCNACNAVVLDQMDLPVTFDDAGVEYGLIGFGGAENSTIVADPTNAANTVAQVVKAGTAQSWAGTTITGPAELGLANAIPFAPGQTQMTLRVWSPDAGIPVRLKVEDHADNTRSVETEATTTQAAAWETLTFNFANQAAGTAAINYDFAYDKASVFFNFGTTGTQAGEKTYYFDDLAMAVVQPTTYNVTFSVDMNGSGVTPSYMNLSGSFNEWCGNCAQMSDSNGDGVWELTVALAAGNYEYKFSYDNWAGSEQLADGLPCVVNNGGFVNRALVVDAEEVLPTVCYASCIACGAAGTYNITFRVDMNTVTEAFTTPEVNGTFNAWCGACAPLSDANGDGVWEITIPLAAGSYEYKFAADNWAIQESLVAGSPCTVTTGAFTNRTLNVTADAVLDLVCWGTCSACDNTQGPFNITFRVDMSQVTAPFTTPEVNGTFNNWCGGCAPMADADGDDIWELTIPLNAGTYEYKFAYDSWAGQEELTQGSSCTTTIDNFTNRSITVEATTTLDNVCWGSCAACIVSVEENAAELFTLYPNPTRDMLNIRFNSNANATVRLLDARGTVVMTQQNANRLNTTMDVSALSDGLYFVQVMSEGQLHTTSVLVQKQ